MVAVYAALALAGIAVSQVAFGANACHSGHKGCGGGTQTTTARTTTTGTTTTVETTTSTASTTTGMTTTTATTTTVPTTTAAGTHALPYRYTFNTADSAAATAAGGWNVMDAGGKTEADAAPAGTRALVWEGDYDNATCSWEVSDATLRNDVQRMLGDPHVLGFFFSDEPYAEQCPTAPAQHAARNALIKSIDPSALTVMLVNANGSAHRAAWKLWSTPTDADVIAINPYPCPQGAACDWSLVTKSIAAADAAGFRYWFAVQSFADSEYRFPTASELQTLLGMATQSHAQGLMTFAWRYDGQCLCDHPDLLSVWGAYNHS